MWQCQNCGETLEEQFESCWKCGTAREVMPNQDVPSDNAISSKKSVEPADTNATLSTEQAIAEILRLQREQQGTLDSISSKVGCLFAWMLLGIAASLVGLLLAIMS
jgi:hypothetical protein